MRDDGGESIQSYRLIGLSGPKPNRVRHDEHRRTSAISTAIEVTRSRYVQFTNNDSPEYLLLKYFKTAAGYEAYPSS